jgi:MoxR-like ATPase
MTTGGASEQAAEGRYTEIVPIKDVEDFRGPDEARVLGDRRDGKLYRYTPKLKLCINVALATGRPLLVLGPTGCGKSSLAFNLARIMRRRYYEFVVTSRSQGRDLLYRFDAVRRFGDAQLHARSWSAPGLFEPSDSRSGVEDSRESYYPYIEPGPLWWIIDRASAARRGYPGRSELPFPRAEDPMVWGPAEEREADLMPSANDPEQLSIEEDPGQPGIEEDPGQPGIGEDLVQIDLGEADLWSELTLPSLEAPAIEGPSDPQEAGAVLLIDEVDKAEPDFPNNLLVPLGSRQFIVDEVSRIMRLGEGAADSPSRDPLVVITSNGERDLPEAFVRRCVVAEIPIPRVSDLVEIARIAFSDADADRLGEIALRLEELRGPEALSIAEYLDAVTAIRRLDASGQALSEILLQTSWRANSY